MLEEGMYLKLLNSLGLVLLFVCLGAIGFSPHGCGDQLKDFILTEICAVVGASAALVYLITSYFVKGKDRHVNYILQFLLAYFLFYTVSSFGLSQIKDVQMYVSHSVMHKQIAELEPMQFAWTFFGYSSEYKNVLGWVLLSISILLCFRQSRLLGTLIMTGLLFNILCINLFFDVCLKLKSLICLSASCYILLSNGSRLSSFFFKNQNVASSQYPIFPKSGLPYQALNCFKLILITGILVFYGWKQDRALRWTKTNQSNPIEGTWDIVHYQLMTYKPFDFEKHEEFLKADMFIFERGVWGYVVEEDSMSMFKYLIDTSNQQFELYDFHEYRSVDLKGRYELDGLNTLRFHGKNNRDSLIIELRRNLKYNKHK